MMCFSKQISLYLVTDEKTKKISVTVLRMTLFYVCLLFLSSQIFVVLFWCLSFEIQQPQPDVFNLKRSKNNREHVIVARGDDSGLSGSFDDQTRSITLQDSKSSYFVAIGRAPLCYIEGTNTMATLLSNSTECVCQIDYFGAECGIPAAVWHRTLAKKYQRWKLKPRKVPRRVIHGLNINHEVDFFRVRLEELKVRRTT